MGNKKSKFIQLSAPEDAWTVKGDLGSGSYGKVHLVQRRTDGVKAAAKVADIDSQEQLQIFNNEINIIALCSECNNVTQFLSAYYFGEKLWIVIELCKGGSISDLMDKRKRGMTEPELQAAAYQMLDSLTFLHSKNVIHRDINSANTMVTENGVIKLGDFGVSCISGKSKKRNTFIGTPLYMAPEVINCDPAREEKKCWYQQECDVWSLGITFIEFAETRCPFSDLHPMKAMMKITGTAPVGLADEAKFTKRFTNLLKRMLQREPKARAQAFELMNDGFVKGQNDPSRLIAYCSST